MNPGRSTLLTQSVSDSVGLFHSKYDVMSKARIRGTNNDAITIMDLRLIMEVGFLSFGY
jgi:hypothetical protein